MASPAGDRLMGTSIGAAIDYLVAGLTNGKTVGAVTIPPLTSINPVVEVADNLPQTASGVWVIIGRTDTTAGTAGTGTNTYVELGATRIEEQYTLPGLVYVETSGPGQKAARDAAIALYDGVVRLVHADPTLGGLLERGRVGLVSSLGLTQTDDDHDAAGAGGVVAQIHFDLQIQNTYIP